LIAGTSSKATAEAFKAVLEVMFPFIGKAKDDGDRQLIEKMQQEVRKGPLFFSPVVMNSLRNAVKKVTVADDFKQKLKQRIKKRE
jgi:hypothetical protein